MSKTLTRQIKDVFNYIYEHTNGDIGPSGGCYIDYPNGNFIGCSDIEMWLDEWSRMNDDIEYSDYCLAQAIEISEE